MSKTDDNWTEGECYDGGHVLDGLRCQKCGNSPNIGPPNEELMKVIKSTPTNEPSDDLFTDKQT